MSDVSARIPVAQMQSLMATEDATPLLGEYDVGPTWYDGVWWHVPTGELDQGFVRADVESSRDYYQMFRVLTRSAAVLAEQFSSDEYDELALQPGPSAGEGENRR